jgi:hypothetical protein
VHNEDSLMWFIAGVGVTIVSLVVVSLITQRAINKATKEYEQLQNSDTNKNHDNNNNSSLSENV